MANEILIILGTRPEAIKLLPLYLSCKEQGVPVLLCSTFQHSTLLQQVLDLFGVVSDFQLSIMQHNQSLAHITSSIMTKTQEIITKVAPSLILVQGDTTTALTGALAGFYNHIPVGHVEAGLRTYNMQAPFPEEFNRQSIGKIASLHFAPTQANAEALYKEAIPSSRVFITGNTVVDALVWVKNLLDRKKVTVTEQLLSKVQAALEHKKKIILFTAHRRESFGQGLKNIFGAIKHFAKTNQEVMIFYPLHPNPHIAHALQEEGLEDCHNIIIMAPLRYEDLVFLLYKSSFVVTDSGGIQEEAVSIGKTVLILRELTERNEGIQEGLAHLIGTDKKKIIEALTKELNQERIIRKKTLVYGNGTACNKIIKIIQRRMHCREKQTIFQVDT